MLIDPFYYNIIFFIFLWIAVEFLLAQISGWSELSQKYRSDRIFSGKWKSWSWGRFNWVNYRRSLWVGIAEEGLYLKTGPLFFYRAFHPPLFIPWSAVESAREEKYFWLRVVTFKFAGSETKFSLQSKVFENPQLYLGSKLTVLEGNSKLEKS